MIFKHVQVSGTDRGYRGADHFDWPRFAVLDATGYDGAARAESLTAKTETSAIAASVWRLLVPSQTARPSTDRAACGDPARVSRARP
ncbi:hypothetical protein [Nucisporomicrobium flavum]|uniref:hypothetical protein n=1 Tax=Nucisporomicrobium flavum TaxID=2785915 RepID=UPI0018F3EE0E|nr:hypothetical protein [Nucisporomicrobium flavum]